MNLKEEIRLSNKLLEQCFICKQKYYFCSHLKDSTPEEPKKTCKQCYDKYTNITKHGLPTSIQMFEVSKAQEDYEKEIYKYILPCKKLMKYSKIPLSLMLRLLLSLEQYYSVEIFGKYRDFLSKEEHLFVCKEVLDVLCVKDANYVTMTDRDSDKYKQLYYVYLKYSL